MIDTKALAKTSSRTKRRLGGAETGILLLWKGTVSGRVVSVYIMGDSSLENGWSRRVVLSKSKQVAL